MKAAVIGAGYISRHHIKAIQALPDVELAAVCDRSDVVAQTVAEQFRVPQWYTDHRDMLQVVQPSVTHITTPIRSHLSLATDAIQFGSHVVVEKPVASTWEEWQTLQATVKNSDRWLVEDHNYRFNRPFQVLLKSIADGSFGELVHVDIMFCLDLSESVFNDPNLRHDALDLPGGAIADFLPHMAYLSNALIGSHRSVSALWAKRARSSRIAHDEFRALVEGQTGTASLNFSGHSQPDGFWITAYGTRMQSRINLFEDRITSVRVRNGPSPLMHLFNGLDEGKQSRRSAQRSLTRKLSGGPASYDGLFELVKRFYEAIERNDEPPVTLGQIDDAQKLVRDLVRSEPGS